MNSEIRLELLKAVNKCLEIKPNESWLCLVGKETYRYEYEAPVGKILYTLKYEDSVKIYEKGQEITLSQDVPDAPSKKVRKVAEQPDKPCGC
jgi:hypothetical protein